MEHLPKKAIWITIFKNGLSKICRRQHLKNLKWYKGCLPQILLDLFLNTSTHMKKYWLERNDESWRRSHASKSKYILHFITSPYTQTNNQFSLILDLLIILSQVFVKTLQILTQLFHGHTAKLIKFRSKIFFFCIIRKLSWKYLKLFMICLNCLTLCSDNFFYLKASFSCVTKSRAISSKVLSMQLTNFVNNICKLLEQEDTCEWLQFWKFFGALNKNVFRWSHF